MELELFVRYFGFTIVALFLYAKIFNMKEISKPKVISAIIFTLAVSALLSHRLLFSPIIILVLVGIFVNIAAKIEKYLMIPVVVISVGVSMGVYMLSEFILMALTILADIIYRVVSGALNNLSPEEIENLRPLLLTINEQNPIIYIPIAIWEAIVLTGAVVLVFFLTRIKRLKSGFIFLESKKAMSIGMTISTIIIAFSSVFAGIAFLLRDYTLYELAEIFTINPAYIILTISFFAVIVICMVVINFWWRHSTTLHYKQRIYERNTDKYLAKINDKDRQIEKLIESNEFLSKAIHRDNKLVPAMYTALASFLGSSDCDMNTEIKTKGENILTELNDIMQERKDMIIKFQRNYKPLPSTGIERVDNILNYMLLRASEDGIQFDFVLGGDISGVTESGVTESVISKQALETLLADLVENAIIAVSHSDYKKVLLTMGIVDNCLEITIQDSGIPFEADTLSNLGIKKSTTHADTGGSGIGYITIFEILNESKASLVISQQTQRHYSFTKSVKVRFDGKREFIVV